MAIFKDPGGAPEPFGHSMTKALEAACGDTIAACARQDTGRFNAPAMNEAFYATTQTYRLPLSHLEGVRTLAPEAGNLLTAAFPA